MSSQSQDFLLHYGIKGMHWGIRKTPKQSNEVLFISGSSKTQDKQSPYYQRKLPKKVRKIIKQSIKSKDTIVVGDAPGIDRQTQNYLKKKHYKNVEIYGPGVIRYSANKQWKAHSISDNLHKPDSEELRKKKDQAMTNRATKGLAVILDNGSKATRKNIERLSSQNKQTQVYELYPRKNKKYR